MNRRNAISAALAGVLVICTAVSSSFAASTDFSPVGRVTKTFTVQDQSVQISVDPSVRIAGEAGVFTADMAATFDLSDVQTKLPAALGGWKENDDCGKQRRVSGVGIGPVGNGRLWARADLYGAQWSCGYAFGHRIYKTIAVEQRGHIAIEAWPVINGDTIGIDARTTRISADGLLGALVGLFEGTVHAEITNAIRKELTQEKMRFKLPPELQPHQVRITEASFVDIGGGRLGLHAKASGSITQAQLAALIGQAIK